MNKAKKVLECIGQGVSIVVLALDSYFEYKKYQAKQKKKAKKRKKGGINYDGIPF